MGPKKKGKKSGKKKGKSARKSGKGSALGGVVSDVLNDLSKEFYLVQIRDLEQKLARYQTKCDELEIANREVDSKFDQQASDKKEIISFLNKQLEQRADEIADLQERILGLQHAKDTEKDRYELQLTSLRAETQEMKDQLTSEIMVLGGKLASLEEFRVQKEDLMNKFEEMEELLRKQEVGHSDQIYQLERKAVVDKDRLKKEMILRVNTVASEFRKVSNKQMAETTKRTIRENVMINGQLSKMSDKTVEMISENDELKDKEKKQKQHLEILEYNETELMKKNASNQKVIRMLADKAREQEERLHSYEQRHQYYTQLEKDFEQTADALTMIQEGHAKLQADQANCEAEKKKLRASKKKYKEEKEYLVMLLSESADVIKNALQSNESSDPATREASSGQLLHKVIDILNLAAELGVGVDPSQMAKGATKSATAGKKKTNSKSASGPTIDFPKPRTGAASRPLAHYKLGDLGLVPPPRKHDSRTPTSYAKRQSSTKTSFFPEEQSKTTPDISLVQITPSSINKLPLLSPIKQK